MILNQKKVLPHTLDLAKFPGHTPPVPAIDTIIKKGWNDSWVAEVISIIAKSMRLFASSLSHTRTIRKLLATSEAYQWWALDRRS